MKTTYTVGGATFTLIPGKKRAGKAKLRARMPELYPDLLERLAQDAGHEPEVVQDALHDILLQELERGDRRGIKNLKSYLKTAAIRKYGRDCQAAQRRVPFTQLGLEEQIMIQEEWPGKEPSAGSAAMTGEYGRLAWSQLEHLSIRQRYVLTMWCCGLPFDEIAKELDITMENVRFHKHVAIQALRARLGIRIEESA